MPALTPRVANWPIRIGTLFLHVMAAVAVYSWMVHSILLKVWITAVAFYAMSCLGVTAGNHRYFTHKGYKTYPAVEAVLLVWASWSFEGSTLYWVRDHRNHHKYGDVRGFDPHSP